VYTKRQRPEGKVKIVGVSRGNRTHPQRKRKKAESKD